jgi:ApbE superfamily uncharacterized protein (UPF0280 family)
LTELFREAFNYKDAKCTLIADKLEGLKAAKESIERSWQQIEAYALTNPKFLWTLQPLAPPREPLAARLMCEVAEKTNVGPMAAVAGVFADLAVKEMLAVGCEVAVVEDGGEVSAVSNQPIDVAVAAGDEPLSRRFGFRLTEFPIGLATSSGQYSRAFSFGEAEAATVFCKEAGLADAAATAVCNIVKGKDAEAAIQNGLKLAQTIPGVEGALIIYKGNTGTWGKIPQIIKIEP